MITPNQKTILLVEDDLIMAMMGKKTLEKYGYKTLNANSGEEAIDIFKNNVDVINLILMDIDLGSGIDGTETAAIILKDHDVPVVFLSSHTETEIVEKTEKITSYGYVVKGTGITVLDASIKMAFKLFESKTNEKKASYALQLSEHRFRTAFMTGADTYLIANSEDGKIIEVNDQFTKLYKYERSEVIGKTSLELGMWVFPEARKEFLEKLRANNGRVENFEVYARGKDGKPFWVLYSASELNIEGSKLLIGAIHDITEQKKYREDLEGLVKERTAELAQEVLQHKSTAEALCNSEIKYRNIVDNSTGIILEWDSNGNILFMNRYGLEYFGFQNEEIIGRNVMGTIVAPVDTNGYDLQTKMKNVQQNPEDYYSSENENIRKNGEKVWIVWTNKAIRDENGRLIKTLSFGIDRTRQKLMEKELEHLGEISSANQRLEKEIAERRKSEEKYRLAMEAANEGIWDWDLKTGEVYYSPAYYKMLGYDDFQFEKTPEFWKNLIHPDDREIAILKNSECIEGKCENFSVEFRMKAKNGEWRWILGQGKSVSRDENSRSIRMIGTHKDITERKRAEKALQLTCERLTEAQKIAKIGDWEADLLTGELYWSQVIFDIFGLDSKSFKPSVTAFYNAVHPDDREMVHESENRSEKTGLHDVIHRIIRPDGEIRFVHELAKRYEDNNGKLIMLRGTVNDITERMLAENDLKETESRFRAFVEQAPVSIGVFNLDGTGSYANDKYLQMLGLRNLDEFIGRPAYEYFAPQFREDSKERTRRRLAGLPVPTEFESIALRSDDTEFPVHLAITPIKFSGKTVIIGFVTDLTERKRAEENLRINEQRLHIATRAGNIGIWDWDVVKNELIFDDSMYSLYGITKEDFGGAYEAWSNTLHPDDRQFVEAEIQAAIRNEREYGAEFRIVRKDGVIRIIKANSQTIRDRNGKALRMIGTNVDITDLKLAEEALRKSEELFKFVVQNSTALTMLTDETGNVTYISPQCEIILGYPAEKFIGQIMPDIIHPDDIAMCQNAFDRVFLHGQKVSEFEYRIIDADNNVRWISHNANAFKFNESFSGIHSSIRDITERKIMEEKLRENENNYRTL